VNNKHSVFDLRDRVIILTGGAGMLGREHMQALAGAGAYVVIADTDSDAGPKVVADAGSGMFVETDVTSKSSVEAMVSRTLEATGRIDGLVNNAAIDPKFDPEHADEHLDCFENFPLERWNHSVAVNLTGMFLCAQAVARPMLARGQGVIVNVSSIYGLVGPDQRLYEGHGSAAPSYKPVSYSVTKSAVLGLTRYLATYWSGKNIRVNTLTPGGVYANHSTEFVRRYSDRTPMGRMANRDEYCGALLFLLSDTSSYMTGANLVVDGGWTAW
jgi:NAD(P)-dependent dehydrogenase (short-subunit alcohol dehydrogenase family)